MLVDKQLVRAVSKGRASAILLDARAPERYRGESEPIDPRAGHIPGALSAPTAANLDGGRFQSPESLRARFDRLGIRDGRDAIAYCGSGVTAAHEVLALELAGLDGARLYGGSWSEWSNDESLPAATGDKP
jgi:thiosulfate/3-mercaptopyruvate sulfurtransferase